MPTKALQRTPLNMLPWCLNMVLPTMLYSENSYVLMLHVDQISAMRPFRYLSSPPAHMTIILPCSKRPQNTFEPPRIGASYAVGPNQILPFHLPTSSAPPWMLTYLFFRMWILKNPLHSLMQHTPMICATADLLQAMPSFSVATPSPTNAKRGP